MNSDWERMLREQAALLKQYEDALNIYRDFEPYGELIKHMKSLERISKPWIEVERYHGNLRLMVDQPLKYVEWSKGLSLHLDHVIPAKLNMHVISSNLERDVVTAMEEHEKAHKDLTNRNLRVYRRRQRIQRAPGARRRTSASRWGAGGASPSRPRPGGQAWVGPCSPTCWDASPRSARAG